MNSILRKGKNKRKIGLGFSTVIEQLPRKTSKQKELVRETEERRGEEKERVSDGAVHL